jgi:hypothetical protein
VEEPRLKKANLNWSKKMKLTAILTVMIITIPSLFVYNVMLSFGLNNDEKSDSANFWKRPCKVGSIMTPSGEWVYFDSAPAGKEAEAHVTVSDTTGITIVADFFGFWRGDYYVNTTQFDSIDMPGTTSMHVRGAPMLPRLTEFLEIPHNIDVSLEILSTSSENISDYVIRPALGPTCPVGVQKENITDPLSPSDTLFDSVFGLGDLSSLYFVTRSDSPPYPGYELSLEGGTNKTSLMMRGHRLLEVSIFPVQFYPALSQAEVFSQIVFKVKYNQSAQIEKVPEPFRGRPFEHVLDKVLLNKEDLEVIYAYTTGASLTTLMYPPVTPEFYEGAEYLIITTDTLRGQAKRLADWKRQKGVLTKIVDFGPGQVSSDTVKDFLEEVYAKWIPKPTYVLILGDCEKIPTCYKNVHQGINIPIHGTNGFIGSDLDYFTFDGEDDYLPDMIYGRISVDTWEQAQTVVDKILMYELAPPVEADFYHNVLGVAYFEDGRWTDVGWDPEPDGQEHEGFPYTTYSERIVEYIESRIGNYRVHRNYSAYTWDGCTYDYPERFWNGDPLYWNPPASYGPLPNDFAWLQEPDYSNWWLLAENNISANINEGRFLVYQLDHGESENNIFTPFGTDDRDDQDGWTWPHYDVASLSGLTNDNMTPFVVSMGCSVGWFDGERDELSMDSDSNPSNANPFALYGTESFAEEITRMQGGAIGVIAASRPSYTQPGLDLVDAVIHSLWTEYSPFEIQPNPEMGTALLLAKMHVDTIWRDYEGPPASRTTAEIFHLFGDPELQVRTQRPHLFDVDYPITIGTSDPQRFVVKVFDRWTGECVSNAKVCVQQDPDVYEVGYTDSAGQVIFNVAPTASPDFMNVTVTKHNFVPHIGVIFVKDSGATITLSTHKGAPGDPIDFEISGFDIDLVGLVYIKFDGRWVATIETNSDTARGYVPWDMAPGFANVWAVKPDCMHIDRFWTPVCHDRFLVVPDDFDTDPTIYSQWDESTWDVTDGELVWDNPDIWIEDGGTLVTEVERDKEYDVKILIHNWGTERADDIDVDLYDAPFGGGVSWRYWGDTEISIDAGSAAIATIPWTPLLPGLACLKVVLYHERDMNPNNNFGQENVAAVELTSPGRQSFEVGNPSDFEEYVHVRVRQQGDFIDTWNATIDGYSSQMVGSGLRESIALLIDPGPDVAALESRLIVVDLFINGELVGGMTFNATQKWTWVCLSDPVCLAMIAALFLLVMSIICHRRRKQI